MGGNIYFNHKIYFLTHFMALPKQIWAGIIPLPPLDIVPSLFSLFSWWLTSVTLLLQNHLTSVTLLSQNHLTSVTLLSQTHPTSVTLLSQTQHTSVTLLSQTHLSDVTIQFEGNVTLQTCLVSLNNKFPTKTECFIKFSY